MHGETQVGRTSSPSPQAASLIETRLSYLLLEQLVGCRIHVDIKQSAAPAVLVAELHLLTGWELA